MGAGDGSIIGLTKFVDAGSAAGKWNLVTVAEGYQLGELRQFDMHARAFAAALLATPPFPTLIPAINVYRLDVSSTDSGADDPAACGGTGAVKATFFDASFCHSGFRRYLKVDSSAVVDAVEAALPEFDVIAVIVNSTIYGGFGDGQVAVFSLGAGAFDIGLHELGHSAFGLADEYSEGLNRHPNVEPAAANITVQKVRAKLKWANLVAASTPIPTEGNPVCGGNYVPSGPAGLTGTFEGARRFNCKVFRSAQTCKMRQLNAAFCAVCQAHITKTLSPYLTT